MGETDWSPDRGASETGESLFEKTRRWKLPAETVERYRRFSLYNSPYVAHDRGHGIDLYPGTNIGISPVAGRVRETKTVGCPDRSYAVGSDHLILLDVDASRSGIVPSPDTGELVARVLHVDPAVDPGERVAVGDPLGEMVRSGFFGQWVDNHVHLELRPAGRNPYRAAESLPLSTAVPVTPMSWDGRGRVVDSGPASVVLDAPAHPGTGTYAALSSDGGLPLDGGLAHYTGGGVLSSGSESTGLRRHVDGTDDTVDLLRTRVGTRSGRTITWSNIEVRANGTRTTGISLFATREPETGAKLVFKDGHRFAVGDRVEVSIEPTSDPITLG